MNALPLRLAPGTDLRSGLEQAVAARNCRAAFVISGIGSLGEARLRRAGMRDADHVCGDLEILTLSGTVAANGSHLHISIAGADGRIIGGHVTAGCSVRTTAEVLLILLPEWSFTREHDPATGFSELVMRRLPPGST